MSALLCSFKRTEFTFAFETVATVIVNGHNYVIRGGYEIPKITSLNYMYAHSTRAARVTHLNVEKFVTFWPTTCFA